MRTGYACVCYEKDSYYIPVLYNVYAYSTLQTSLIRGCTVLSNPILYAQDVEPFIQRTGALSRTFSRNHRQLSGGLGGRAAVGAAGAMEAGGENIVAGGGGRANGLSSSRKGSVSSTGAGSERAVGEEAPR